MKMQTQAKYIWCPGWASADDAETRLACFRTVLDRPPEGTVLRITADTRYKLYVNGRLVQVGPQKGDDRTRYIDTVDIRSCLRPGKNVLAVSVLRVSEDDWNSNHSLFRAAMPFLYVEGVDAVWRCHINRWVRFPAEEKGFSPLHIHETASADPASHGWTKPDFDDSGWDDAKEYDLGELPTELLAENLRSRTIPFMDRVPRRFVSASAPDWEALLRRDVPVTVPANAERTVTLDAGEELTGFIRLSMERGAGAEIELLYSECYVIPTGYGVIKSDRLDAERGRLEGYRDRYSVLGAGSEQYEPFWFRTFRFVQVTVRTAKEPLTLSSFTYEETGYPLAVRTSVETSDRSLGGIWDISLRTLRRCMHETYIDCPYYEQLQYVMDTRVQALYTYAVSADDRLARQAMEEFCHSQRPDGLLNACYPNKNVNVIPGFSIYYILMLHDHMMYFGDRALIAAHMATVERILTFFRSHRTPGGLVDKIGGVNGKAPFWSFIDWANDWLSTEGMPTAGLHGPITMESLLYILGLQKAGEMADWIGMPEKSACCRAEAASMQAAVRAYCTDKDGMLTDGPGQTELSQHCQVFGVLTGTLTREQGRRNLLRSMEDQTVSPCSVAMSFYLFRALEKTELYDRTDRYWGIWRRMLENGCTTCVEAEGYARSECHAWGALALYELPSAILGVRPAAPGYEKIEIRPTPGYLTSASGTVLTPQGEIRVEWRKRDGGDLAITIECGDELKQKLLTK